MVILNYPIKHVEGTKGDSYKDVMCGRTLDGIDEEFKPKVYTYHLLRGQNDEFKEHADQIMPNSNACAREEVRLQIW